MANNNLRDFISGATNPKGNLGDWRHAARLFVDDAHRLAPKSKFSFYVVFSINSKALKSPNFMQQHRNEINMLVKRVDLPRFTIQTEKLNQYNRKKVAQVKSEFNPINIIFHDDNINVVNQLWQNYYAYYYADPVSALNPNYNYKRNAMQNGSSIKSPYGLDNNSSIPFFDKITIYHMARKSWVSYTLVNPVITEWKHDTLDYSESSRFAESSMSLDYEAVSYSAGEVTTGEPPGFGFEHYDTVPSPITPEGGGTPTLVGPGGVVTGIADVMQRIASGQTFESIPDFITTAITGYNTINNISGLSKAGIKEELTNLGIAALGGLIQGQMSGLGDASFPVYEPESVIIADPINLNGY